MEQIIIEQSAHHPSIVALFTIIGILRLCMKPLMELIHTVVKATKTEADDRFLLEVEASKAWKSFTWALDWLTSIKVGPQYEGLVKSKAPFVVLCLMLSLTMTGCTTALKSDKIVSVKTRGFGIRVGMSDTTQTPKVELGFFSSVYQMIPTSTNGTVYAPKYFDTLEINQSANPFNTGIAENTGSGDVMVSTNAQGSAIIPKLSKP